ncbi:MAG: hypothetical protein HW397_39 [Dehalococcoidia bacterium]|nr:hypothetical protein [Dehalococcoidia bacterium]
MWDQWRWWRLMARVFDQILDECIDRIVRYGDSVELCLSRYPQHAAALEEPLRAVYRLAQNKALSPRPAAKERGRERLRQAQAALESTSRGRRVASSVSAWGRWRDALSVRPSWRLSAGLSFALLVFLGAPTLVAASGGAVPGDTLYPVKRGVEQTRLALEFSQERKANLHADFSERRAGEIAELVSSGDSEEVASTQKNLDSHLRSVVEIVNGIGDTTEVGRVQVEVEAKAARALAGLQVAMQEAPKETREAANDSFQASSESFGDTVESVAKSKGRDVPNSGELGKVQIVALAPSDPMKGVGAAVINISRIDILRAGGPREAWVMVTKEPLSIDLNSVANLDQLLGSQDVPSGTYSKVRFSMSGATITVSGVPTSVRLDEETLILTRPFQVQANATTLIQLDFDGSRSFRSRSGGEYELSPVARVLARDSNRGEPERPDPKKTSPGPKEE